jgi:hypothetical protein
MFNKPTTEAGLFKSSYLGAALGAPKFTTYIL